MRLSLLVLLTTLAGFLMASPEVDVPLLLATVLGTASAAAGAMALNQTIEWRRDAVMQRTRERPVPSGEISPRAGLTLGIAASAVGVALLASFTGLLAAGLALAIILLYALVYTPLKTRTPLCTLVGAVCGALPPMVGWAAAAGRLSFGAFILGTVLFLWQIPHFLALAWLYREDYCRGGFRMLPSVDPSGVITAGLATLYALALLPVTAGATLAGITGWLFATVALTLGSVVALLAAALLRHRSAVSARRLFLSTLVYLPLVLVAMVADRRAHDRPTPHPGEVARLVVSHTSSPATGAGQAPAVSRPAPVQ